MRDICSLAAGKSLMHNNPVTDLIFLEEKYICVLYAFPYASMTNSRNV